MAGGPGGTGAGIQSESLAWAIIMSAFAGACPSFFCAGWQIFKILSSVRRYSFRVCRHIAAPPVKNV
jgi:hypothetical protein